MREEIRRTLWESKLPSSISDSLVLHWGFNQPEGQLETDLSGNGNHGVRGAVPGYHGEYFPISYAGGKSAPASISPPSFIMSSAPRRGSSDHCVLARPSLPIKIPLNLTGLAPDDALILDEAPQQGELRLDDGSSGTIPLEGGDRVSSIGLSYHPPDAWTPGLPFPMNFTLSFQNGTRHSVVSVYPAAPCEPMNLGIPDKIVEGQYRLLRLGEMCADGHFPVVEVLRPPAFGKLYQLASDIPLRWNVRYQEFGGAERQGLLGPEIKDFPAALTHPQGWL